MDGQKLFMPCQGLWLLSVVSIQEGELSLLRYKACGWGLECLHLKKFFEAEDEFDEQGDKIQLRNDLFK